MVIGYDDGKTPCCHMVTTCNIYFKYNACIGPEEAQIHLTSTPLKVGLVTSWREWAVFKGALYLRVLIMTYVSSMKISVSLSGNDILLLLDYRHYSLRKFNCSNEIKALHICCICFK